MTYEAVAGRDVLPIPDIQPVGLTTCDAKDPDTTHPPIEPLRPPAGAPNVLVVLIDDVGFGASSAFGGPCRTPNHAAIHVSGGARSHIWDPARPDESMRRSAPR
jgi:arylsulfatase